MCAFKDGVQKLFKCDTVDATCKDGDAGSRRFRQRLLQTSGSTSPRSWTTRPFGVLVIKTKFGNILVEAMMAMKAFWDRFFRP